MNSIHTRKVRSLGIVTALVLLMSTITAYAQGPCGGHGQAKQVTNTGTEFLLAYDQNETPDFRDSSYQDVFLATLDAPAVVTITCPHYPSFTRTFNLTARSSTTFRLSDVIDPLMNSDEVVDNTVVHVVSDNPIVCYGFNRKYLTTDAFLALPKNVAGTDYRVMSYYNSSIMTTGFRRQSEFSVAAFENNTTVTITPTATTAGGKVAGTPLTYTLNAGEGVQIQADPNTQLLDLTGSHVTSDHPIVVYGAHVRAEVPVGYVPGTGTQPSRDHLSEAIPPTSTWGEAFVCTSFSPRTLGDMMRILALNDGTTVSINGVSRITLNHDQFYDTLISGPVAVQSSGPVLAGMFAHTAGSNQSGDPFFAIQPPLNETYTDFTFFTSTDPYYTAQFVIIVTDQTGAGKIVMDGATLPASAFIPISTTLNGQQWAVATVSTPAGPHHITSSNDDAHGFTILSYGFGVLESYGYTAGALLKPLRGAHLTQVNAANIVSSKIENTINIRNSLAQRIYLDSMQVILDPSIAATHVAHVRENVAMDISQIEVGQDVNVHIDVMPPLETPVNATVKCFTHSALWFDMEPSGTLATLRPVAASSAAVAPSLATTQVSTVSPNPFTTVATISFSLSSRADVSLKVYDDLGRLVSTLMSGEAAAGPYNVRFESGNLPAGHYTYELKSEKLNLNERASMVLSK